jgi:uncharacterized iron-regulated membrane protein
MMGGLRQSMAWLHTWSGLLVGWILFMVFAGGTASYFRDEITLWMKPELHRALPAVVSQVAAADRAQQVLEQRAPTSPRWFLTMPAERNPALQLGWVPPRPAVKEGGAPAEKPKRRTRRSFGSATIDPATGADLGKVRDTRGGDFFFRLHFDLHYMSALWGRWIVGFCAMSMLVAILSGIVTHKRIFKDFFTFRPGKGQRSWLDAHNVTAVLALPYHLMITYTGLVTLMFMYLPAGVNSVYPERAAAFYQDLNGGPGEVKPAGVPATLTALGPLVEQASRAWQGAAAGRLVVNLPGDANATVTITQQEGHGISYDLPSITFNGVTGALLTDPDKQSGGAVQTRGVMYGLHVGRFADPLVRALFFLSGLAGCAMVATGVIMWAVKERPKHAKKLGHGKIGFGLRLVDGLNLGSIAGLMLAMAAFFWANRLLPGATTGRPDAEIAWFFTAWGVAFVAALVLPTRPMWKLQLALGGLGFALLPVLNAATGGAGLFASVGHGIWAIAGFDLVSLALGLLLLYAAARLRSAPAVKKLPLARGAA